MRVPFGSPNAISRYLADVPLWQADDGSGNPLSYGSEGLVAYDFATVQPIVASETTRQMFGLRPIANYPFNAGTAGGVGLAQANAQAAWPAFLTDRFALKILVPQLTGPASVTGVTIELEVYSGFDCDGSLEFTGQFTFAAGTKVDRYVQISGLLTHYWEVRGRIVPDGGGLLPQQFALPMRVHVDRAGGPWQLKWGTNVRPSFPLAPNVLP